MAPAYSQIKDDIRQSSIELIYALVSVTHHITNIGHTVYHIQTPICRNVCFPYGAAYCFYVLSGMDNMDTEIVVPCHIPP